MQFTTLIFIPFFFPLKKQKGKRRVLLWILDPFISFPHRYALPSTSPPECRDTSSTPHPHPPRSVLTQLINIPSHHPFLLSLPTPNPSFICCIASEAFSPDYIITVKGLLILLTQNRTFFSLKKKKPTLHLQWRI